MKFEPTLKQQNRDGKISKEVPTKFKIYATVNSFSRQNDKYNYSMFQVTWATFKFNKNQLGTVSAFVMISVPWSDQRVHQAIGEKILSKEFHCRTTDHM